MRPLDIALAIFAVTIWGGNFVAAKITLAHYPPLLLTMVRFALVAVILVPFVPRPKAHDMAWIFGLSVMLGVLHFALIFGSLYVGVSVMTSILVAQLGTPFACLLAWFIYGDRMDALRVVALMLAFLGVAVIAGTPDAHTHFIGFLMALFAGFAWGAATIILKRINERNIYVVLGWMAVFSIPQLLVLSLVFEHGQWQTIVTSPPYALWGIVYTVLLSTFVAYGIWYDLLYKYTVSQVAPFALLTPVTGIFLSRFYQADPVTLSMLVGGALTLFGVALTVLPRPATPAPPD